MAYPPSSKDLDAWALYVRGGVGYNWPELRAKVRDLVRTRINSLPWVPPGFADAYEAFYSAVPGDVIVPMPVIGLLGNRNYNAPAWLDSNQKLNAWQQIYTEVNAAISNYISGKSVEGAQALATLNANSVFWNTVAGGIDKAGAGIGAGAKAAGEGIGTGATVAGKAYATGLKLGTETVFGAVKSVAGGVAEGAKWVVILGVVGVVIYFYVQNKAFRGAVGGMFGKK